jgi:pyridoxal phosphate enzyme (YggS family)
MSKAENRVDIAAHVARLRSRIAAAAGRRGRSPDEIRLVAAAKTVAAERVEEAIGVGIEDIGENYVQEAAEKRLRVTGSARWHMIGHLQRNKVRQAVEVFDIIQTVDSRRLAEAIGQHAAAAGRTLPVLLQVNTSGEVSKFGVEPEGAEDLLLFARGIEGLRVEGLMTVGRWDPDPERARPEFRLLAELGTRLESRCGVEMKWLSMGMSHDFEIAIEEGANLIRVGTGVFGPRKQ